MLKASGETRIDFFYGTGKLHFEGVVPLLDQEVSFNANTYEGKCDVFELG